MSTLSVTEHSMNCNLCFRFSAARCFHSSSIRHFASFPPFTAPTLASPYQPPVHSIPSVDFLLQQNSQKQQLSAQTLQGCQSVDEQFEKLMEAAKIDITQEGRGMEWHTISSAYTAGFCCCLNYCCLFSFADFFSLHAKHVRECATLKRPYPKGNK